MRDLLDATQARYRDELHQPEPPAFLIYIDQGEELLRAPESASAGASRKSWPKASVIRACVR